MAGQKGSGKQGRGPNSGFGLGKKPRPVRRDGPVFVHDGSAKLQAPRPAERVVQKTNKRLGEFVIDRFSHDGRGVSQLDGKLVFIEGALPGETVSARWVSEHSRFIEARVDEVIQPSQDRVTPFCPHYHQCGGCQLQHVEPVAQVSQKQQAVLDQLLHWGKVTPDNVLTPVTSVDKGYRSRARLGVWIESDGRLSLGFRAKNSKKITSISECRVLDERLNGLLVPLQSTLQRLSWKHIVTHIECIATQTTLGLIVRHTKAVSIKDREQLRDFSQQSGAIIWFAGNQPGLTDMAGEEVDPRLFYQLDGLDIGFHPQDFTQINRAINQQMWDRVATLLAPQPNERILDLFCGVGNFTLPLAQRCRAVVGIEGVDVMVARGRENAERLGITNATFEMADLTTLSEHRLKMLVEDGVNAVLLDPPRDGAKEIVTSLVNWVKKGVIAPSRVVYVSCNPATLARDAALFTEVGYALSHVGVLDMFPHTAHVESIALFERN